MNKFLKVLGSLLVGAVCFAVVAVGVTEALAPHVWPSALLGLPAGLVAGTAAVPLTYLGLSYREERAATGRPTERTRRRLRATVAGIVGFVATGGITTTILLMGGVGLAGAMLFVAFPVGLLAAVVSALVVFYRARERRSLPGSTVH